MFAGTQAFNQDIGSWNTSNVTNMTSMFQSASSFGQYLCSWDVDQVTSYTNFRTSSALDDFRTPTEFGGSCGLCPPGEYVNGFACTPCNSGTYKAGTTTATSCNSCPSSHDNSDEGRDDITDCWDYVTSGIFIDSNGVNFDTTIRMYYNSPRAEWDYTSVYSSYWTSYGPCYAVQPQFWGHSIPMTAIGQVRTDAESIYQTSSPCHEFQYNIQVEVISNTCVNVRSQYRNRDGTDVFGPYEDHGNICEP